MEEVINIDLPNFKATYKVKWSEDVDINILKNAKQVNGILFNNEGKILIINIVGNWQLPGGHIEKGESYEEGLRREISEEADIEVEDITPFGYLRVAEIKEGILQPESIQLYCLTKVKRLNKQTVDPCYNKISKRKFIDSEKFTTYIPWGNIGNHIANRSKELFLDRNTNFDSYKTNLFFMSPLEEFFKFKRDIDKFMDELHPLNVREDYLKFVSGAIKYADMGKEISESVTKPNWDMLSRPKSYLRPFIFLLLIKGLGRDPKDYVKYSALLELIHNGTLIHDDIEDNALVRRRDKPIHLKYGLDIAVNSANLLYFTPFLIFRKYSAELPILTKLKVYDCLIEHLNRVTWGQGIDLLWHNNKKIPTIKEYLQMCCYKTGAIDRMVFSLAGILAVVDDSKRKLLEDFGENLGICLQIHDDFCDIFSIDRKLIGKKSKGNDISEGKKSFVNILALNGLELEYKNRLLNLLSERTHNKEKIKEAVKLIKKSGALEKAIKEAKKRFDELKVLSSGIINKEECGVMISFLEYMNQDIKNKFLEFKKNETNN